MKRLGAALAAGGLIVAQAQAAVATTYIPIVVPVYTGPPVPPHNSGDPSLYLQCDGNPAHMSDAEKFARFMGAITLLGLFAPRPEVPEPGKRVLGAGGVAACTTLIDGAAAPAKAAPENNGLRRLPLILARAAHRIEAKDYAGAIVDVHKARDEATALHLTGDPYFDRSMGLSFDQMEAIALMLSGDGAAAREASLRHVGAMPYSYVGLIFAADFSYANTTGSAADDTYGTAYDRLNGSGAVVHAVRLQQLGRFAEAATLVEAVRVRALELSQEGKPNGFVAFAAVAEALAGNWSLAKTRADEARAGLDEADAAGTPDAQKGQVIDYLDFLAVLQLAHDGHLDDARRNFAARSEWSNVNSGAVWAATDLLRAGARPDQLTGALAHSRTELEAAFRQRGLAQLAQAAGDNKTLFSRIVPYAHIDEYEKLSKAVWNTGKSDIMGDKPMEHSHFWLFTTARLDGTWAVTWPDALLLHAALQAKARGQKFVYIANPGQLNSAWVLFGNPAVAGGAPPPVAPAAGVLPAELAPLTLDPDAVIAELRLVIPSPDELKAREAVRDKAH